MDAGKDRKKSYSFVNNWSQVQREVLIFHIMINKSYIRMSKT